MRNIFLLLAVAVTVCSCVKREAIGYQPMEGNHGFGYADRQTGPGQYTVQILGNIWTDEAHLQAHFARRAHELCGGRSQTRDVTITTLDRRQPPRTSEVSNGTTITTTFYDAYTIQYPLLVGQVLCQ